MVILAVQGLVEDTAFEAFARKIGRDEGGKVYVSVVELWWDWAGELELVGFEGEVCGFVFPLRGVFCADYFADEGREVFGPVI